VEIKKVTALFKPRNVVPAGTQNFGDALLREQD
jgi:hypothetical protein